ncbi:MAG TPA: ChbG/HpnK family deacetylase [Thermoanaerobaculia bacterium]|nr:ChbG/HpnK family deacetylase [Thermoanaerobaculia bacterium]
MRRLVVTADDAGLHPGMTLGVARAFDRGIVTAASVAAVGRAFDHAVEVLKVRPGLDAGAHLTLVGERPLSPPSEIPSLVGGDGAFLPGFPVFATHYMMGRIALDEVRLELGRQVERLRDAGLALVHANSHQHLHALPGVFEIVLELAAEHRIPWVRVPRAGGVLRRPSVRGIQLAVLDAFGRKAGRRLEAGRRERPLPRGIRTAGIFDAGHLTPERLHQSLAGAEDIVELVCHPGLDEAAIAAEYDWGYAWEEETAALCDPAAEAALERSGCELTSFSLL